jgi:tripartite-type tricarboxylate transporter receptor subunit TctC
MFSLSRTAIFSSLLLFAISAAAQNYPKKPVQLIVPLAAGSTADILARTIQPQLASALGQPVIIENRPGAGGTIAMDFVAHAAPDGYTLVMGTSATWGINPALYKQVKQNPLQDFVPVAYLAASSNVVVVAASSSMNSLSDLVNAMKDKPGKLAYSSGGSGTTHHLSGALLNSSTATEALHVPYKGAPQGVTAVLAGEVDFGIYNTPSVVSLINAGKLKALAYTGATRSPLLPTVPIAKEGRVPNYVVSLDFGILAPAGTPESVVSRLHNELQKIMESPALRSNLTAQGFDSFRSESRTEFSKSIKLDMDKWGALVSTSRAAVD